MAKTTGLWSTDDAAYRDGTGTYAIVIGVSKYPHLVGGESPAPKTYGFGQLYSSSYSAHGLFQWLRTSFRITGSPVRKVWLLLAPTTDEARLIGHDDYAPATFQNCASAIREWFNALNAISAIGGTASANTRSLFFFSGHGVEINKDKQVLLPSDYLSTTPPMLTDAISTYNLHLGMGQLGIPIQCFLADACRSDAEELRQQNGFDGSRILPEPFGGQKRRNAPIVYATAEGNATYQSTVPEEMSFFARGLLSGLYLHELASVPALRPDLMPDGRLVIKLPPLCEFINAVMNNSLQLAGYTPDDPITIGGTQKATPIVISEVSRPPGASPKGESPGGPSPRIAPMGPPPPPSSGPVHRKEDRFRNLARVSADDFGHESVTAFFRYGELTEFDGVRWSEYPHHLMDHVTRIDGEGDDYRRVCFVSPDASKWSWLRCENEWAESGFLFPPTDRERQPAEFAIESVASPDRLGVRAVLSPYNGQSLALANDLWRSYVDVADAESFDKVFYAVGVAAGNVDGAIDALYHKWESPLAATIGSMILLRGGLDSQTSRWQENLAHGVAYSSDAAIFVLQRMIQTDTFDYEVARRCLASIQQLGLPFTSEAFAYLANLAAILERQMPGSLAPDTVIRISDVNAYTKSGSLFLTVYASAQSSAKGTLRERLLGDTVTA